jgi:hypothetical protein
MYCVFAVNGACRAELCRAKKTKQEYDRKQIVKSCHLIDVGSLLVLKYVIHSCSETGGGVVQTLACTVVA